MAASGAPGYRRPGRSILSCNRADPRVERRAGAGAAARGKSLAVRESWPRAGPEPQPDGGRRGCPHTDLPAWTSPGCGRGGTHQPKQRPQGPPKGDQKILLELPRPPCGLSAFLPTTLTVQDPFPRGQQPARSVQSAEILLAAVGSAPGLRALLTRFLLPRAGEGPVAARNPLLILRLPVSDHPGLVFLFAHFFCYNKNNRHFFFSFPILASLSNCSRPHPHPTPALEASGAAGGTLALEGF